MQSLIYRILPKVNQVIYNVYTIVDPNIMTLAQAVLEIYPAKKKCNSKLFPLSFPFNAKMLVVIKY